MGMSAARAFQTATQSIIRFVMDNPVWIAIGIVLLLILIWWSRPRAR